MRRANPLFIGLLLATLSLAASAGAEEVQPVEPDSMVPSQWQRLGTLDAPRYSPQWAPDGNVLIARGAGGVGVFAFDPFSGYEWALAPDFRGPSSWLPDGRLCLARADGTGVAYDVANPTGKQELDTCTPAAPDDELGTLLFEDADHSIWFNSFAAAVTLRDAAGVERRIADGSMAYVKASPDGERIVFNRGTLGKPQLEVADLNANVTALGRGAQASWLPDSRHLVFSIPGERAKKGRQSTFSTSALYLLDLDSGTSVRLADTPDVVEMEPAVSPDGKWLAFANWTDGSLYVASLEGRTHR